MEALGVAQVADDVATIDRGLEEAQLHAVQRRDQRLGIDLVQRAVVHGVRRLGRQDARAVQLAALQVGDHEAAHVRAGRRGRAGRGRTDDLEALRGLAGLGIALSIRPGQVRGQRLAERGVVHLQRAGNVAVEIVVELLARHALDDVGRQGRRIVRIGRRRARVEDAVRQVLLQVVAQHRLGLAVEDQRLGHFLEAGRMGHQLPRGDRLAVEGRDLEVEVLVDVGVEVDLAGLDLLHHGRPGEQLRDRAGTEQSLVGIDRRALVAIGIPEAARRQDLAVLDHRDHRAGDVARAQGVGHVAVQPEIDIGLGQAWRGRWRYRGGDGRSLSRRGQFGDRRRRRFLPRLAVRGAEARQQREHRDRGPLERSHPSPPLACR